MLRQDLILCKTRTLLKKAGGTIHGPGGAGELLGVNPNSLRYKMQKLGIAFKKGGTGKKK